jgi:phospholipid transport system substrate-binding protein
VLASFLVLALAAKPAPPLEVVQTAAAQVQKILEGAEPRLAKIEAVADEFLDFSELARRALGKTWGTLKPAQQTEFVATMKGLLRANYAQKALSGKQGGGEKPEYLGETVTGNEAVVRSRLKRKGEDPVSIEYKLFLCGGKCSWKLYDVVTDDVSLVTTYADEFRKQIAKKGFDGLLASLKSKRDQLEKENAAPAAP